MIKSWAGALAGLLVSAAAWAGNCPAYYVDGRLPEIKNPKLAVATRELCYGVFGVVHSGVTRTPLWSAEFLKPEQIEQAQQLSRENNFHAEPRLPPRERAELADYARSGFDRGHMSPNGDMPDRASQRDSFALANIVPQNGENNRHLWSAIEQATRKLAKRDGGLYVLTGPAYLEARVQKVGNVLVPSHLYKAVYSPKQKAGAAWFVRNEATEEFEVMNIAQLEDKIGINLMPSLSPQQKTVMLALPTLKLRKKK
ncbi:DNA/RNA non-specific endonuclease [Massilia sp. TS11]|uniref:DNA/RNA non-specific endonuclease n=1 Tax=Massilia sp. TS11 TaxID=2908003 RepID=UPI001EDBB249|nr:DNA/RNA non-specific endonuclease [Massilia sp. TS11]MCG2584746.1 DNA/RNA non-specific endonuclease [Massilia sp. TS11]